jgi:thymidylate kinase/endonuclease III
MTSEYKLIGRTNNKYLQRIIEICSKLPEVKMEVKKNHDDNLWWPLYVSDWRLRMVVAGWSSRISYNSIAHYKKVVSDVNNLGYEKLCNLSDPELRDLIGSLGLFKIRRDYLHSLCSFIEENQKIGLSLLDISNDKLIGLIAEKVRGASYKVAQCAVLYAKGYYCGVFPIDSGMKDMLGPCIGMRLPSGSKAHEAMRKQLEGMLSNEYEDMKRIINKNGYSDLNIPQNQSPVWWSHLVLIYFKRMYCNKRKPKNCPLRADKNIGKYMGQMCHKTVPYTGGFKYIILEGVDQVGKSTIAEKMKIMGYSIIHSSYNPNYENIFEHYKSLLSNTPQPTVFDRTFISEIVYGIALRNQSRISEREFSDLLLLLKEKGYVLFFIVEDTKTIRERMLLNAKDHEQVIKGLDKLLAEYSRCMREVKKYIPVVTIQPTKATSGVLTDIDFPDIENE